MAAVYLPAPNVYGKRGSSDAICELLPKFELLLMVSLVPNIANIVRKMAREIFC